MSQRGPTGFTSSLLPSAPSFAAARAKGWAIHATHTRAVGHTDRRESCTRHAARAYHPKNAAGTKNRQERRVVLATVNVRGLPYVIPGIMSSTGEESDERVRAYRKEDDEFRGGGSGPRSRRPTAPGRRG
jgi:hypothetical protein